MKEKTRNEGGEKCANPHDSCAISHSQHNGNAKKASFGEAFEEKCL